MKQPKGSVIYEASFPVQLMTAGMSACFADFLTFPLDTAKVRLQVSCDFLFILLISIYIDELTVNDTTNQNKVETSRF